VTKPELGTKRRCNNCETKFFDLNIDPIVCPKCRAVFASPQPERVPPRRLPGRQTWPARKVSIPIVPNEFASVEGKNVNTETRSPAADADEVNGDLLLLDDQDGKLDAGEIIGADMEKDDT
jgi:uncharacterized protein (TIGR02300 family)